VVLHVLNCSISIAMKIQCLQTRLCCHIYYRIPLNLNKHVHPFTYTSYAYITPLTAHLLNTRIA